ncbi:unnamed protein product [Vitrella brassicaformis CCMP3155]|uniref:Uncharacterized protein n=1 Tax=Vitrella brassicaformis (strain CCMP3155) TaxID=1169540 RepID=A0A0G4ESR8_VITBC|nr:unnamed protein product [Vitrella brassicaformis CCMP3155]|eukprot:CEM01346.1 unnamed protein product [Vitrella brassicaformis CCMP3155]
MAFGDVKRLEVAYQNPDSDELSFASLPEWLGGDGALAAVTHLELCRVGNTNPPPDSLFVPSTPNPLSGFLSRLPSVERVTIRCIDGIMASELLAYLAAGRGPDDPPLQEVEMEVAGQLGYGWGEDTLPVVIAPPPALVRDYGRITRFTVAVKTNTFTDDAQQITQVREELTSIFRFIRCVAPAEAHLTNVLISANHFPRPRDTDAVKQTFAQMHDHTHTVRRAGLRGELRDRLPKYEMRVRELSLCHGIRLMWDGRQELNQEEAERAGFALRSGRQLRRYAHRFDVGLFPDDAAPEAATQGPAE